MPKFKVDFVFDEATDEEIPSKEVELPLERAAFTTAYLDLGEALFLEYDERLVSITTITALEDMPNPSIKPDTLPIKQGDVVWCDWDELCTDGVDEDKMNALVDAYKPLWEAGPGYGYLMEFLCDDPD